MVKVAFDSPESADGQPTRKTKPAKKSRWFLRLSLLSVIAIAAAPSILSLTSSMPTVIRRVHPKLANAVSFGSVKMHWWSPVEVTDFKLLDLSPSEVVVTSGGSAPVLCEAERITTIEPLWRIALNGGRGTGVVVKSPRVNLIADEQGSNIDRTMTELFGTSKETTDNQFPFRVTIENGSVELRSATASGVLDPTLTAATLTKSDKSATDVRIPISQRESNRLSQK